MTGASTVARASAAPRARRARAIAGEQLTVAGGQLAAGVGNLLFSLALARLLAPAAFADMAAFLALYLVIHVPAASLSAGSALSPELADRGRRLLLGGGTGVGLAIAAASLPLAHLLHLPVELLLILAASAPTAGLIALDRGRLYGLGRHRRAIASLLAEPIVRLGAGVALAATVGPVGGAATVVVAGWAALLVARLPGAERPPASAAPRAAPRSGATVGAFLGLALVQNQDVLLAKGLLPGDAAGHFAVLSTLGGVAAFATTTIPLVLLPRSRGGERGALAAALAVAVALGAGAVLFVLAGSEPLVTGLFGSAYADVAPLAAPYVGAMALLGVARVLIADACARGRTRAALAAVGLAAAVQLALILLIGDDPAGIAAGTLVATGVLTMGAGGAAVLRFPPARARVAASAAPRVAEHRDLRIPLAVAGITLAGLTLRLLATRGIWLDEAISIHQAQMPFGAMLENLRTTDVHPPLHHIVLWAFVHLFGTGEWLVRLPSLVAGTALIPVLYVAGRDLYDKRAGIATAALGACAPFAIWYSQEARMYAFFMLFATVAVWMQVRAARDGRPRDWALYALASAALVWSQYFAILFVGVQQLGFVGMAVANRREGRPLRPLLVGWLASALVIALLLVPLASFAQHQFQVNESSGKGFQAVPSQTGAGAAQGQEAGPSIYGAITNFVWAVWGYHSNRTMTQLTALWPFGMLLALLLLGRGRSRTTQLVVACALLPAVGLYAVGQIKPFVFEVRYFIGAVPMLLLLIGRMVTTWAASRRTMAVAGVVLAATLALGAEDQQLNGTNPRIYDFKGALGQIESRARPGDIVLYSPPYLSNVVAYYGKGLNSRPLARKLPKLRPGQQVFILGSFLDKPQYAAATGAAVASLRRNRTFVDRFERPQIRVWEFRG